MVVILRDDGGLWSYGAVIEHDVQVCNNQSYKIHWTKTECIIMRTVQHMMLTPLTTEQYLRDQLHKTKNYT